MSERGYFLLDRSVFSHPLFDGEPFTKREAWIWLIAQAAYRPHVRYIGITQINLERGQAANSLRFLAEKWGWSEKKVRGFLSRLESDKSIEVKTDAGITVVTIRNYEAYQTPLSRMDAAWTQHGRKEEEREHSKVDDGGGARASDPFLDLTQQIATIAGHPDPKSWPPSWCGAPLRVRTWLAEPGWTPEIILAACREAMAKKRDGPPDSINYFEKAIARAVARQATPLPKVVVNNNPEILHVQADQHHPGGAYGASKDAFRAAHAELRASIAEDERREREEGGGPTVELLPPARRG